MAEDYKETILTQEGVAKLEEELRYLKTVKRKEVAERIKQAIAFGDLSENSEYDEAKNEQAFIEGRIVTLENLLRNAKVIDDEDISTDVVSIGVTVKLLDVETNDVVEYTIVGSTEANPAENRISNKSPVGKALLGKPVGAVVDVHVPDGVIKFKILEIRK
ncbi:transcription elongation factor GreA [Caldicoprobacter algeriensis]|jgi:transcription elongation factor GreA|uniref:Transcription elongation factor GreA n=1 Tax=Caldicoprobacter faecalis TaxID=937334 RepID=A0A1I5YBW3_9FIRM|nr:MULTISPECIES: transcription elongation factor GreA [Caldicoprobacter]MCM8901934.1 transcription elongation factor GreA [Caldicoprobacter algeriensis]PZN08223.1 MAG: transcription elongation factor GreA [Caldicoprobacter oshimai]SFQ41620.1 transcription elongation factor GreA [Caldicoprobacter faecalis]